LCDIAHTQFKFYVSVDCSLFDHSELLFCT